MAEIEEKHYDQEEIFEEETEQKPLRNQTKTEEPIQQKLQQKSIDENSLDEFG